MRDLLRSNPMRLTFLLWFASWMVVVMPGHTRGVVKLPDAQQGQPCEQAESASCCKPAPSCCDSSADDCPPSGPTDPAKHCAICFLKAKLTDPPPITLYTPYLGELDELAFHAESSIADDLAAPKRVRGRAPPA